MRKGCSRWGLLLGVLALAIVCLATIGIVSLQARASAVNDRPLVLIHTPINHGQVHVGDRVLVHATSRANNGLRRIELWADGTFVGARDATGSPTMLVLANSWTPTSAGSHTLVVRAVAANGVDGQATVMVDALPQEPFDLGLEPEAAAPGTGAGGDGSAPDLDGGEPGDYSGVSSGDGGAPEERSDPPAPEGDAPASDDSVWGFPFFGPLEAIPFGAGEPVGLRVEFLGLGTAASYEQLHCYVGYGDIPQRWFPDSDGDQTTDESFEIASAEAGGVTIWNMASLSGASMPVFEWPRNRDLPVNVSCVGIVGGGTDAVELGRWEGNIEPERWTGTPIGGGAAGMYEFAFRITRTGLWDSTEPVETNFDMTPPSNVHFVPDGRPGSSGSNLRWDYLPRPEEPGIDGFRVYLNGSLQWAEPAEARASSLPSEWINPPCGTTYRFDVSAYRSSPDSIEESTPAAAFINQSAEDCAREIAIHFVSLETFDLGDDGDDGERTGDIGPAYGFFWANEQQVAFNGGHLGPGLDLPFGLSHNTTYNIREMASSGWNFSGEPSLLISIPEDGAFEFGFHISDEDSGRCRDSDDPGCGDLICEGFSLTYEEESATNALDSHHEETITSEDGRCRLTVQWGPAAGSPVGTGVEGWEPLPWLSLEKMTVDEATGQVRLSIRNTGTAAWPARDLNIELQNRFGISQGIYTWSGFTLEAGQRVTLEHPDMRLTAPFDACVMIDPYNDVVEEYERSGALWHIPICPPLPDLVITSAIYDPSGGGRIRVAVRNVGEGALENRTLALRTFLADSSPLYLDRSWPNINLAPGETRSFDLSGVTETAREQMRGGYTVVVNPDYSISEEDLANNTFNVDASTRLWINLYSVQAPMDFHLSADFHITATVISGSTRRQVADWRLSDIDWGTCNSADEECALHFNPDAPMHYSSNWFDISGDETLTVSVTASSSRPGVPVYWNVENFTAPDWGGGPLFNYTCGYLPTREPGDHAWTLGYHDGAAWAVRFDICRENYMEP